MCIPLCASILFVLPAGNHTHAISAFVSYTRVRNHNSKCAPPAGHHRVVLSISAPVNKNHCAFYPSASPSQSVLVHSSLCNPPTGNPPLQSVRVCPTSASATTVHLCVPPATIRTCAFYFYISERKSFMQSTQSPT